MRLLVTGATGMLGKDVLEVFEDCSPTGLSRTELDVSDSKKTIEAIHIFRPEVVINCAAYTRVDDCECNQERAFRVNALGPRNLAVACRQWGSILVHISTDYVFDGSAQEPYTEFHATTPLGIYGKSKLAGEKYVCNFSNKYFIIRTSWLFGKHGANFVEKMLSLAREKTELHVVNDQLGSPTYTRDLAVAIKELVQTSAFGIYHLTNSENCSWYGLAQEIFRLEGMKVKINAVTTEEFPRPAPRPKFSVLDNWCWRLEGKEPLRSYKEALQEYLGSR